MLNFLTTFGADSQFQKNRLLLTKINYQTPNEQSIKSILRTFAGQDQQIRSQIAFATMLKKIHNSNSKDNWIYLLKNLIIFDRVMSDNRFCQQLAQTKLVTVQNYVDSDIKSITINSKLLIKKYWQLIQDISRLKISQQHILYYKRSQRKTFLQSLNTHDILNEILILQRLFQNCCSLIFLTSGISRDKQNENNEYQKEFQTQKAKKYYTEFITSGLAQYLNIHFYSKLLTVFSCEYLCIHKFIQNILQNQIKESKFILQDIKYFKKLVYKFKQNCKQMIVIAEKNKGKKGFENIQVKQFLAFSQDHIVKILNEYIEENNYNYQSNREKVFSQSEIGRLTDMQRSTSLETLFGNSGNNEGMTSTKFVERKPLIYDRFYSVTQNISPRKLIQYLEQNQESQAFQNYFNTYSQEFPHKNMMTIDLIEDIRRDEQLEYEAVLKNIQKSSSTKSNKCILLEQQEQKQNRNQFFKDFKGQKSRTKLTDLLVLDKNLQTLLSQKNQNSTDYSFKNSARKSLFEPINIKLQS